MSHEGVHPLKLPEFRIQLKNILFTRDDPSEVTLEFNEKNKVCSLMKIQNSKSSLQMLKKNKALLSYMKSF